MENFVVFCNPMRLLVWQKNKTEHTVKCNFLCFISKTYVDRSSYFKYVKIDILKNFRLE